ncbi:MAG: hypothetical protein ACKV2Q_24575 [Planctomycetaceae bacterium]
MAIAVWTYVAYLVLSATITVWVAETLARHGRVFLIDVFHGNTAQADAVNRLLVAGFYLLNLAGVLFNLTLGSSVTTAVEGINFLSSKIGLVLTVLGAMHFFNLTVLTAIRRWSQQRSRAIR